MLTAIGSSLEEGWITRWPQVRAFYAFTTSSTRYLSSTRSDGIPINERALGKWGMSEDAQQRLGSLAGRYCQQSIAMQLGPRHTFRGSTEYQVIVESMRPYTWAE